MSSALRLKNGGPTTWKAMLAMIGQVEAALAAVVSGQNLGHHPGRGEVAGARVHRRPERRRRRPGTPAFTRLLFEIACDHNATPLPGLANLGLQTRCCLSNSASERLLFASLG